MSEIQFEIDFGNDIDSRLIITYQNDVYKINDGAPDDLRHSIKKVNQYIDSEIKKYHPNNIYLQYTIGQQILYSKHLEIFGINYATELCQNSSLHIEEKYIQIIPEIQSKVAIIFNIFPFLDKYCQEIFDGWFLNGRCSKCNSPVFYDSSNDAKLCFECDEWLETPVRIWDEDNSVPSPEKPSLREKVIDTHRKTIYHTFTDNQFSFSMGNKESKKNYIFERLGKSDFRIIDENRKVISIKTISELSDAISEIIDPVLYNNILHVDMRVNIKLRKNLAFGPNFETGSHKEKIHRKMLIRFMEILNILTRYWINPV